MFEDHRGVVGTTGPVADRKQSLAELLDREVLPCLERPGRLLGPFDLPSATVTGETKLALVWPSVAEGAHAPAALRPLLVGLPDPRPFQLSLGSVPSPNLRAALRQRGLPAFGRPEWEPLAEADLWLVWLETPLQLLGLVGLLQDSGLDPRAVAREGGPRVVVAGPAAARFQSLLRVYADAVLPELPTVDAAAWRTLAEAARSEGEWTSILARDGEVLRPVEAVANPIPPHAGGELPPPERHNFDLLDALSVGMDFLRRPDWDEAGRVDAYTRHVMVGSGSERLRAAHGLRSGTELVAALAGPLGEETASLCLHFVLGLPGETAEDRKGIVRFLDTVIGAAPRGVRQVSAHIHELRCDEAPAPRELCRSRASWLAVLSDAVTRRRLSITAPPCGTALVEAILAEGPDRAPLLEWMVDRAADQPELANSLLAWRAGFDTTDSLGDEPTGDPEAEVATGLPARWQVEAPARVSPAAPRSRPARRNRPRPDRWTRWRALTPQRFDYRIEYAKEGRLRFLGPTELSDLLLGACERAQIPVSTTGIVQPRLRVGYGPSLPAGIAGDHEYIDLSLDRKVEDLGQRLRTELPDQLRLHAVEFMPRCSPSMQLSRVALAEYEAELEAGQHLSPAAREQDIARVKQWNRRIEEGMPAEASDESDPIHQLCAIHFIPVEEGRARLEFTLDLRLSGARCKPRDVVARALPGLAVDPRLINLRRRRLLVMDEGSARARLRTPLEQVQVARRQLRIAERKWAE